MARAEDLGTREFTKLLRETGLDKTLMMGGPYTLFAPTDSAFRGNDLSAMYQLNVLMLNLKAYIYVACRNL